MGNEQIKKILLDFHYRENGMTLDKAVKELSNLSIPDKVIDREGVRKGLKECQTGNSSLAIYYGNRTIDEIADAICGKESKGGNK